MNLAGVTVAMVQMPIANNPRQNARRFIERAKKAVAGGADIVVGSEMMLSHYLSGDRYEDDAFVDEMVAAAGDIISESKTIGAVLIFGGIAVDEEKLGEDGRRRKYNVAYIAQDGQLVHNHAGLPYAIKTLLPNYRMFDDARHFFCLRKLALERDVSLQKLLQPFPVVIRGRRIQLGVKLCEDMWDDDYFQKPALILARNGADVFINLSCSPWSWRKNDKRDRVVRKICKLTGLPFIYVNNVGCQNNGKNFIVFDGASTVYDQGGSIVALTPRYTEAVKLVQFAPEVATEKRPQEADITELFTAITIATRGFLETLPLTAWRKVVIGVSGGIDSALSVAFFAHLLGPENVIAVNMPYGNFNSAETKADAALLCQRLGVEYRVVPIDVMVDARCALTGIKIGTSQHKTVQAIERMNVLAAIASAEEGFFTCNANWTEIMFGYGTLNGDMRGTFAPWMNCLKQDVYRLAEHLNQVVYGYEVIPQSIIDRPPMDELTAVGAGVRSDPFDYGNVRENGYHDQMVRAVIAFRRSAEWFLARYQDGTLEQELQLPAGKLARLFPTATDFVADLERCFGLFHASIFKRVQSVPGPLVDKRSFGFDYRESILPLIKTRRYEARRAKLLAA